MIFSFDLETFTTTYARYASSGGKVTIAAISGTDSITITDFFTTGNVIKAKVNLDSMTISIPIQVVGTQSTYGDYYIYPCIYDYDEDYLSVYTNKELTGTISEDGLITIDSQWGLFYPDNSYALIAVYNDIKSYHSNSKMIYNYYDYTANQAVTDTIPLYIYQNDADYLYIVNYYNFGTSMQCYLYGTKQVIVPASAIFYGYGSYAYLYSATFSDSYNSVTIDYPIKSDATTDLRTIKWGEWTIADNSYFYVAGVDCTIETDFDIAYPDAATITTEGEGTASSPYLIKSVDDWNNLVDYAETMYESYYGKYIKLANDIDFDSTEIRPFGNPSETESFRGDLDGGGYTIKGITYTAPYSYHGSIVDYAVDGACIHDLTVEGSVELNNTHCGGVVGYLYQSTIKNVKSNLYIDSSSKAYVGGVVGYPYDSEVTSCSYYGTRTANTLSGGVVGYANGTTIVSDCHNYGNITFRGQETGGVVGCIQTYYGAKIINCNNYGYLSSVRGGYLGGILGYGTSYVSSSTSTEQYEVTDTVLSGCCNYGTVYTQSESSTNYTNPAGIAGWIVGVVVSDCHNYGVVDGYYSYGGGVVGYARECIITDCTNDTTVISRHGVGGGGIIGTCLATKLINCVNYGTVTNNGKTNAGGIASYVYGRVSGFTNYGYVKSQVINCVNYGAVTCDSTYTGGIVAKLDTASIVTGCANFGPISGKDYYVGGIIGYSYMHTTITDCYNAGTISGKSISMGGILGTCSSSGISLSNCFNVGDITSTSDYVGGISGCHHGTLTNVYNMGNVSGASYVGGITGYSSDSLSNAYNAGSISATESNYGSMVGSYASAATSLSNTAYYLTTTECGDCSYGTGLSYAELAKLDLGDSWTAGDNYTYPRITSIADNDYAKAYAAAIVPADGDSYSSITTGFNVGTPDGVTWTAPTDAITFDGNTATFTETVNGTVALTATCGDVSVTTEVTCNVEVEGINDVMGNALEVVSEKFYTASGIQVAGPSEDAKAIYIVVKTYDDGTTETVKEVH